MHTQNTVDLSPKSLDFRGRIYIMMGSAAICFLLVISGYWSLQVRQKERYEKLGEQYRIKTKPITSSRGFIYDRNGSLIAQNRPTYNLAVLRDEMEDPWSELRPQLALFLGETEALLDERFAKAKDQPISQPVILQENISFKESLRARRNLRRFPGLHIDTTERRFYVNGHLFTHVLGHLGESTKQELKRNPKLKLGEMVGKTGVERAYDGALTGVDGVWEIHIDNKGIYRKKEVKTPPQPGKNLYLTLDLELQQLAYDSLAGRSGSVVMMEIKTGEILVYLSSPSFDLNLFTERFSTRRWNELNNSSKNPFLNRPVKGVYAPGSVFKLVTALAALKYNKITPMTRYFCNGSLTMNDYTARCHAAAGHGSVDLEQAIRHSCNVFFYNVALDLDIDQLASVATELGFGNKSGVDLIGESKGLVPTRDWKRARYNKMWYPGETLSVVIGQGALLVTPVQLVVFMATVADDGRIPTPHFMSKYGKNANYDYFDHQPRRIDGIPEEYYDILKSGMWQVVNHARGTGTAAAVKDYDVCGKTGTAQLINFDSDSDTKDKAFLNAFFAGFAPRYKPEVAIMVLVEQAGAGGQEAAPIAGRLFTNYRQRFHKLEEP